MTYCGLSDPSNRHGEAQQGVVLILRQPQQLGDILESLRWGVPVQTSCGLTEKHSKWSQLVPHQIIKNVSEELQAEGRGYSHRENAQQLLPVGDVGHHRLCAVEEEQEDVAGVSPVTVDLLGRLLGQAAHHTLHSAGRIEQFLQTATESFQRGSVEV